MRPTTRNLKLRIDLDIGRKRRFLDPAIGRVGRGANTVAAAHLILAVDQVEHTLEIERIDLLDDIGIIAARNAGKLVGDRLQLENIIRNVRSRTHAAPSVVLDHAKGRTYLIVDIGSAEIDAVEKAAFELILAEQLDLVDRVLEIGVAERIARRRDQRRIGRAQPGLKLVRNHRQEFGEINLLLGDAEYRSGDVDVAAILVGRLRFSARMMIVERNGHSRWAFPFEVKAKRLVEALVRGQLRAVREILAGAEFFRIENRASDGAIRPCARRVAMVEPDADRGRARLDQILRIGVIDRRGQRVGRAELENRLAVDAFAINIGQVVRRILRDGIDIGRTGAVGDIRGGRRAKRRERAPVIFRTEITIAPAEIGLIDARLAALIAR